MEPTTSYLWRLAGEAIAVLLRAAPGYEARLSQEASLILSGEPVADFNIAIIGAGPQSEDWLRQFGQVIHERKLPVIVFLTEEVSDQLAPLAQTLSLQKAGQMPLMIYHPYDGPAPHGDYQIERFESEQGLQEVSRVLASAFELPLESVNHVIGTMLLDGPGMDIFLAREHGNAISTVQSTRAGDIVGIWAMGTLSEQQRKGVGRALLDYVIAYHYAHGARLFYLLATEAGKPLYERIGFHTISEAAVWVSGHSTQVSGN
jgi:GNAT superfamily N-acetyltransferase